jgi:hypothetical protein
MKRAYQASSSPPSPPTATEPSTRLYLVKHCTKTGAGVSTKRTVADFLPLEEAKWYIRVLEKGWTAQYVGHADWRAVVDEDGMCIDIGREREGWRVRRWIEEDDEGK